LPLVLAIVIVLLLAHVLVFLAITLAVWICWCPRGKNILFVHSNSPVWGEYISDRFLPYLGNRAVVLNWSERRLWRRLSLARLTFECYGGQREFNPLAVLFRPLRPTRTFRFWQPFRDWKHGNTGELEAMEREFFAAAGLERPMDKARQ
jgi:hypothetical protein